MSVPPPELLKMLAAQKAAGPNAGPSGPAGAPMASPKVPEGQREAAMATVGTCLDQLELVLSKLGTETEEGQAVMKALTSLGKVFGDHRSRMQELAPAQMLQMMQRLPPQLQRPGMGGPPGMHPPGMPPGMHPPGMPPGGPPMPPPMPPAGGPPPTP